MPPSAAPGAPAANPTQRSARSAVPRQDSFALSVAVRHAADIGAQGRAVSNARAGTTVLQVADQGLQAIDAVLAKMQALAEAAASTAALTTLSRGERAILNAEFEDLRAEIARIAEDTEFNGIKLLKGGTTITESTETVTESYAAINVDSRIDADDGFQAFVIASNPDGLSDGDRIRIEYDKQTGLFTVTNTTTSQVATAAAPGSAPAQGELTEVDVPEFSLTIQVNADFKPNTNNKAPPGNPGPNEFEVSVSTSTTTTTVTSNVLRLTFQVGTGSASADKITLTLQAATVASLAPDLASDDISSAAGAALAQADVARAIDALADIRASVRAASVGFQDAARNLTSGNEILENLRGDLLAPASARESARDLARAIGRHLLAEGAPELAGGLADAMRDLLLSARLKPLARPQDPDPAAPAALGAPSSPSILAPQSAYPPPAATGGHTGRPPSESRAAPRAA